MKKTVKLGLVQMACASRGSDNLERAMVGVRDVVKKGAQIVCLPELFMSPYFCQGKNDKNFELAESIPGPTTRAMGKIASENKIVILCSLFERTTAGKYFNSVAVIGTDGEVIGVYHKMHIPSIPPDLYAENYYFEKGGGGFPVFDTPYAKIAPLVCYDQWFPEGARAAAVKGAQILFYPTAIGWPQADRGEISRAEHEAWQVMHRSHAIANNIFVCAVNRVGIEGELKFWGTSLVSDPYGRVLARADAVKEENFVVECNLSVIEEMRKEWPFLDERRIKIENL